MKRWFLAVLAVLLLLAPSSLAAKPQASMGLTYEYVSYGYEGNPNDGLLGRDESLVFQAAGSLAPGESYTYTYLPTWSARYIYAEAAKQRGRDVSLLVRIEVDGVGIAEGLGTACIIYYNSQLIAPWRVTVTNVGEVNGRAVYLTGFNYMQLMQTCP